MDDLVVRLFVVVGIFAFATTAAVISRRGRAWRRRPFESRGLSPGIHLFTSVNCHSCERARRVLERSGFSFEEHSHESSPSTLEAHGIDRVPVVAWVPTGDQGGWAAEGVPTERRMRRWVGA